MKIIRELTLALLIFLLFGFSNDSIKELFPQITPHQLLDNDYQAELMKDLPVNIEDLIEINYQGCSWYCCGNTANVKASSSLPGAKAELTYIPANVCDQNLHTAWIEGKKDYGTGESVEFDVVHSDFTTIEIYNGYSKTLKTWEDNSRVKTLKLYVDNHPTYILHLTDTYKRQSFHVERLNINKNTVKLKFEIRDIYPGEKYMDTAITDINMSGEKHHCH